jgi:hypothetical protein
MLHSHPFQKAIESHILLLFGASGSAFVPPSPTFEEREHFAIRFGNTAKVLAIHDNSRMYINPNTVQLQDGVPSCPNGRQVTRNQLIGEENLHELCNGMACLGMTRWTPALYEDPGSLWNLAHEHFALRAFRSICHAVDDGSKRESTPSGWG